MCSLGHLRPHFAARTDDSHAAPAQDPAPCTRKYACESQRRLVRCPVYCRIKPHTPPFQQAPANLIRSPALRLIPRRGALRKQDEARCAHQHPELTVWTTSVSNTDRSPYFRGSATIRVVSCRGLWRPTDPQRIRPLRSVSRPPPTDASRRQTHRTCVPHAVSGLLYVA